MDDPVFFHYITDPASQFESNRVTMNTVSKDLLCRESTYFSAMFEDGFKEGQQLQGILEDREGVVSVQSLEILQFTHFQRPVGQHHHLKKPEATSNKGRVALDDLTKRALIEKL